MLEELNRTADMRSLHQGHTFLISLMVCFLTFYKGTCNTKTLKMARFDLCTSVSSLSCGVLRSNTITDANSTEECLLECYKDTRCLRALYQDGKCLRCNNLIGNALDYHASGILHYNIQTACESSWVLWNGSCYKLSANGNYTTNKASCVSDGGNLVTVETSEENEFLKQFIRQNDAVTDAFFVGITGTTNNTWVLDSNGQQAQFLDFYITEPNGQGRELCIAFYRTLAYKWVDIQCDVIVRAVCEKPLTRPMP